MGEKRCPNCGTPEPSGFLKAVTLGVAAGMLRLKTCRSCGKTFCNYCAGKECPNCGNKF